MQEISVSGVQLNEIDSQPSNSNGCSDEGLAYLTHPMTVKGRGQNASLFEGNVRWSHRAPSQWVFWRQLRSAFPRNLPRSLTPRMGELYSDWHLRPSANRAEYTPHRRLGRVTVEAYVRICNSPFCSHSSRFNC